MSDMTPPPPHFAGYQPAKPPSYLVHSILVTLFCFWPLGIVAIIFAAQVGSKYAKGDYEGATEASRRAKNFTLMSLAAFFVVLAFYAVVFTLSA